MKRSFLFSPLAVGALLTTASIAGAVTHVCPNPATKQARPIPMGVSIGVSDQYHTHCGSGTAGIVVSNVHGEQSILSNNHVGADDYAPYITVYLPDGSPYTINPYSPGAVWSQPGPAYLNCNNTTATTDGVANYTLAVPVVGGQLNLNEVDAAIALVQNQKVSPTILSIGTPSNQIVTSPSLYMNVQGQGASTCWAEYQITDLDYSHDEVGAQGKQYFFDHQINARGVYNPATGNTPYPQSGDSGTVFGTTGSCFGAVGVLWARDLNNTAIMSYMWSTMAKLGQTQVVGQLCSPTEVATSSLTLAEAKGNSGVPEYTLPDSMVLKPAPDDQLPFPSSLPPSAGFNEKVKAVTDLRAALEGIPHFWYVTFGHKQQGLNDHSIVVMVDKVTPQIMDRVPPSYEGFDVKIRVYKGGFPGLFPPADMFPDAAKPVYIDPK